MSQAGPLPGAALAEDAAEERETLDRENVQEPEQDPLEQPLPVLRPDLVVYKGPRAGDGSPTFTVYDPLSRTYDKIGWAEALLFERMRRPMILGELLKEINEQTSLSLTVEEIVMFARDVDSRGLTMSSGVKDVDELTREAAARETSPMRWLLFHYLYFRVPLIRPDGFLTATLNWIKLLAGRPAWLAYAIFTMIGVVLLIERFDAYVHTFTFFFNFKGIVIYGLAIVAVKVVHEFAHAYVAKGLGVRVPHMGVAFIVMWPVAYCDVTDAWKIADRKKRLLIGAAGMMSETVIAGLALFGWGVTGPGLAHSVYFVVSSVTLLSTFLVNLNPAMRFDGYYLLMDIWGIDNLQPRAFAVTRWAMRTKLFGMDLEAPESRLSRRRLWGMVVYSIYCWIYRLFLYFGIAVLVYYKFTKVVGVFLFAVEILWFIVLPLLREVEALVKLRKHFRFSMRTVVVFAVVVGFGLWFCLPMTRSFSEFGIVTPREHQIVYAPFSGTVDELGVERGQVVEDGALLVALTSEELANKVVQLEQQIEILQKQLFMLHLDDTGRSHIIQKEEEIESAQAQLSSLSEQLEQNKLYSEISGKVYEWDEDIHEGMYVARDHILGKIASLDDVFAFVFVDEERIDDLDVGDTVSFYPNSGEEECDGEIVNINPIRIEVIQQDAFFSTLKDDLPVIENEYGELVLKKSYYAVEVRFLEPGEAMRIGQRGQVWMETKPRSRLVDTLQFLYTILIKESGF
ncbi:MAG: HlyD family efflux transporter periplasmic adaptor subunit [Desulfovibrio sp.]|nr:MAG: HlyD family efflux transporter periplasmic adaptor subunit [Desulfovibrio sp.]